jgi:2-methylisocitrate lyase-like PEP mutase family enzyme
LLHEARRRFRRALNEPGLVLAPFVYDGLQAKIAEAAGFDAVYMSGFGTAASRGFPDLGLLCMSEMVENVRSIARAVKIPVICDADTGYGNPVNVIRTVREYEEAGAAALHIEDQVWPKRCGYLMGKEVIPAEQMAAKVRAACEARRDPDLVLIARTDALQPHGWTEAERRARSYREAGADLLFVDGIRSLEDLDSYGKCLGDLPLLYNGQLLPVPELERRGFKVAIHSGTLGVAFRAVREAMVELRATGRIAGAEDPALFGELIGLLEVPQTLELGKKYGG